MGFDTGGSQTTPTTLAFATPPRTRRLLTAPKLPPSRTVLYYTHPPPPLTQIKANTRTTTTAATPSILNHKDCSTYSGSRSNTLAHIDSTKGYILPGRRIDFIFAFEQVFGWSGEFTHHVAREVTVLIFEVSSPLLLLPGPQSGTRASNFMNVDTPSVSSTNDQIVADPIDNTGYQSDISCMECVLCVFVVLVGLFIVANT